MLDGLKFWGLDPAVILKYPYNIILIIFLVVLFFFFIRRIIFILKLFELERNLVKYPGFAEIRVRLGDLYFNDKNYLHAKIFYLQALDMHPGLHYARLRLAEIFFIFHDDRNAIEQLSEMLKRTSEDKYKYGAKIILEKWNIDPALITRIINS